MSSGPPDRKDTAPTGTDGSLSTGSVREMILQTWRLSLLVVTPQLRLKYANQSGEEMLEQEDILRLDGRRVRSYAPRLTQELEERVRIAASRPGLVPQGLVGWTVQSRKEPERSWVLCFAGLANPKRSTPLVELRIAASSLDFVPPQALIAHALGLTRAQAAVVVQLAHGLTINKIASQLGIKPQTVKDHVKAIYQRLGIDGARERGMDPKMLLMRRVMALCY